MARLQTHALGWSQIDNISMCISAETTAWKASYRQLFNKLCEKKTFEPEASSFWTWKIILLVRQNMYSVIFNGKNILL